MGMSGVITELLWSPSSCFIPLSIIESRPSHKNIGGGLKTKVLDWLSGSRGFES